MTYPGGKGANFRHIVNLIPPHDVYIETHLGAGSVMKAKRPARLNIGIEINREVIKQTADDLHDSLPGTIVISGEGISAVSLNMTMRAVEQSSVNQRKTGLASIARNGEGGPTYRLFNCDCLEVLQVYRFTGNEFIYADPPYLRETRRSQYDLYDYEYETADHIALLEVLKTLSCDVMISGYPSQLYDDLLSGWNTYTFQSKTRGGPMATEVLWFNYEEPDSLHDYSYLGDTFRERENQAEKNPLG